MALRPQSLTCLPSGSPHLFRHSSTAQVWKEGKPWKNIITASRAPFGVWERSFPPRHLLPEGGYVNQDVIQQVSLCSFLSPRLMSPEDLRITSWCPTICVHYPLPVKGRSNSAQTGIFLESISFTGCSISSYTEQRDVFFYWFLSII